MLERNEHESELLTIRYRIRLGFQRRSLGHGHSQEITRKRACMISFIWLTVWLRDCFAGWSRYRGRGRASASELTSSPAFPPPSYPWLTSSSSQFWRVGPRYWLRQQLTIDTEKSGRLVGRDE